MSKMNQITNAGALKLQHASAQLQTQALTGTGAKTGTKTGANVQFADLLQKKAEKTQSVQGCGCYRRERGFYSECSS